MASHQQFTQKFNLPFPLLADTHHLMMQSYDVDGGKGYAKRVTYVINPQGTIAHVHDSINTETHATDILADLGL